MVPVNGGNQAYYIQPQPQPQNFNQYPPFPQNQNRFSQAPQIPSRMISSLDEVKPNDVPMDGTPSLFLANDYSCIFAKAWNQQGGIDTIKYVPDIPKQQPTQDPFQVAVMERLDKIEGMLNRKPYYNKNNQQRKEKIQNDEPTAGA